MFVKMCVNFFNGVFLLFLSISSVISTPYLRTVQYGKKYSVKKFIACSNWKLVKIKIAFCPKY